MKKRIWSLCLSAAIFAGVLPGVQAEQSIIEIHVSPSGSAKSSGTVTDPLDSLASAKLCVSEKKQENPNTPINVIFHEGTYRFSEGVTFTADDSGTEDAPITYMAAKGENAVFSGASEIDAAEFKIVENEQTLKRLPDSARAKVYYLDLSEHGIDNVGQIPNSFSMYYKKSELEPSELYLNNNKQTMARWPNGKEGYARFEKVTAEGARSSGNPDEQTDGGAFVISEDRIKSWTGADNAWIVGFLGYDWSYDRVKVKKIDAAKKEITLERGTTYTIREAGSRRWAITNLLEELDTPGEWYIDNDTNILYYYPESLDDDSCLELTTLSENMITLNGTDNIAFCGITFSKVRGSVFWSRSADTSYNLTIDNCTFENIGRYAVWHSPINFSEFLNGNSQSSQFRENGLENAKITNNIFRNIGVSAIFAFCGSRQENKNSNCVISNNYISYIGEADRKGSAVQIYGVGIEIANNTVHETGYGICFAGSKIEVKNNEVYNVMKHIDDGAAIYTGRNFINRGNKIYNNFIHDISAKDEMISSNNSHGIYLDDMDSGTEVYGNIIVGVNNGVLVNCGMSNNVHDNIIIDASSQAVCISTYNQGNADSLERIKQQAEAALENESYSEFHEEIKADVDSRLLTYPVRNTAKNNVMYQSELRYSDYITEHNTVENNQTAELTDFVDAENGDYRLTAEATGKYETNAPSGERFDYSDIGADFSKFEKNPTENKSFDLTYPRNSQSIKKAGELTFLWQSNDALDSYHIIIARDSDFSDIADEKTLYERIYTTDKICTAGTYYWKVLGKNESVAGKSFESEVYKFTIESDAVIGDEDRYVAFDITGAANAKIFAEATVKNPKNKSWKNTLLDVSACLTDGIDGNGRNNYPSNKVSNGAGGYVETLSYILNKTAFDNVKKDGYIYSDSKIPFNISTDKEKNAVKLGGDTNNYAVTSKTIDVDNAKYEELYFANVGINGDYITNFKVTAHYTDGTEERINLDCDRVFEHTSNKTTDKYTSYGVVQKTDSDGKLIAEYKYQPVADWISSIRDKYNTAALEDTALLYRINDEESATASALNVAYYIPVYSVKPDSDKVLDSVTFSGADAYTNIIILGLTGKKTAEQVLSDYENKSKLTAAESDRAYELLFEEYSVGNADPKDYPNILSAKAERGVVTINSADISDNVLTVLLNAIYADKKEYTVISAIYKDGRLVEVQTEKKGIMLSENDIKSSFEFKNNIGAKTVKCFVWDLNNTQESKSQVFEIEGI